MVWGTACCGEEDELHGSKVAGHIVCTVRKQGDECWRLTSSPDDRESCSQLGWVFLSSAKLSRKHPHRHALSCVSRVTLSPMTLTVKMSNDRQLQSFKVNVTNLQLSPSLLCAFSFSIHSAFPQYFTSSFLPPSLPAVISLLVLSFLFYPDVLDEDVFSSSLDSV